MGLEVIVDTMEEMCGMMCDNVIPAPKKPKKAGWWIFTFGCGHEHAGKYVKIHGTFSEARQKMFDKYGEDWAFQYSEENWETMKADIHRMYRMETELEVIE